MSVAPRSVKATGLLVAAGLLSAVGLVAATAAHASGSSTAAPARPLPASTGGNFVLCSAGSYASYAVFEKRGDMSTRVVPAGQCVFLDLTGQSNEKVTLFGIRPDGRSFKIATDSFDDAVGERIKTLGTPDRDDWTTF
ncbi:hypothetical protein ACFZDG_34920 [Kitasatospora xanthocidica]|uniref:hypothetical protein n=1 Tax=Kitasatospora xanthocidica TaxID=83382 RepID=UPI0036E7513A